VNALSGDTSLFAEIDEKYGVYNLEELYELHNQGCKIRVPALLNERGEKTWVEVEDVVSFGKRNLKRITLATTRLYVEAIEGTIIPAFGPRLFSGTEEQINLNFKLVNELKVTQDPRLNATLLLATRILLNIQKGDQKEWDYGFALGFYLSEGNLESRKRKNTKLSLVSLNRYAKQKGMRLEEYLNYMTNVARVCLSVGRLDFERGYVDIIQKRFKFSKPFKVSENGYHLYSSDLNYIHLIKEYTEGQTSHNKFVKNEVFNRSLKFLEGIMDGFLSGDGWKEKGDRFRVKITTNYKLRDDLIFLSKALGYDLHLNNGQFAKSPSSNNYYYHLQLSVFKNWHRRTALGLIRERIKSIEDVGEKEAYNLVLKSLYPKNDKRSVFNHLFFTAYGFLVSDAIKTLDCGVLSSSLPVPLSS